MPPHIYRYKKLAPTTTFAHLDQGVMPAASVAAAVAAPQEGSQAQQRVWDSLRSERPPEGPLAARVQQQEAPLG